MPDFVFKDTESSTSRAYAEALSAVLDDGAKFIFLASLNDQVSVSLASDLCRPPDTP
jgi:hypothetical protein